MTKSIFLILLSVTLLAMVVTVHADTIILKSGEMFQTSKAWHEDGYVCFNRNGKVVRYPESQVERLIERAVPGADKPKVSDRPATIFDQSTPKPQKAPIPKPSGGNVGYLGLKWQQPVSQVKNARPTGSDPAYGGVALYALDIKRFGRASVDGVFLGFWQGGLYTVLVQVSNYLDFLDLKMEAFGRFGKGVENRGYEDRFRWSTPVADRFLNYDEKAGVGYLWMRSRTLHGKVRARYPD